MCAGLLALGVLSWSVNPALCAVRRPPNYHHMPETSFTCAGKVVGGYYADPDADCQMFHVCVQVDENDVSLIWILSQNQKKKKKWCWSERLSPTWVVYLLERERSWRTRSPCMNWLIFLKYFCPKLLLLWKEMQWRANSWVNRSNTKRRAPLTSCISPWMCCTGVQRAKVKGERERKKKIVSEKIKAIVFVRVVFALSAYYTRSRWRAVLLGNVSLLFFVFFSSWESIVNLYHDAHKFFLSLGTQIVSKKHIFFFLRTGERFQIHVPKRHGFRSGEFHLCQLVWNRLPFVHIFLRQEFATVSTECRTK